jgi:hypothetical protein
MSSDYFHAGATTLVRARRRAVVVFATVFANGPQEQSYHVLLALSPLLFVGLFHVDFYLELEVIALVALYARVLVVRVPVLVNAHADRGRARATRYSTEPVFEHLNFYLN